MKTFLLYVNFFLESTFAAVCLFFPQYIFLNITNDTIMASRSFAACATGIASISIFLLLNKNNHKVWLNGFSTLAIFHGSLAVVQLANSLQGMNTWLFFIFHTLMAIACYFSGDSECTLDELSQTKGKKRK